MLQCMKQIDANVYKPSDKKEIDRHDSNLCWLTSINHTINWLPLLTIIEHTESILNPNKGQIPSLLKFVFVFSCVYLMINNMKKESL